MPTQAAAALGAITGLADTRVIITNGTITLPAGGPWNIHTVWTNIVHDVPVAAEGISGNMIFDSLSGDITPDPAPGLYPFVGPNPVVGASAPACVMPTQFYPTNWSAAGKAVVTLSALIFDATTNSAFASAGIIFGDGPPEVRPLQFVDMAEALQTNAAETQLGIIQLSERATRIVGLLGVLSKNTALTAEEGIIGTFRLDSNDQKMAPSVWPYSNAISASLGAAVVQPSGHRADFIPVDIPVEAGSRIFVNSSLQAGVTAGVHCRVYIAYE